MTKDLMPDAPFAGLPDFLRRNKIGIKELQERVPDAEHITIPDVFDEAMRDVRTIPHGKERVLRATYKELRKPGPENDVLRILEEAVREERFLNVTNLPEYMEGYAEGINPLTMDKLRKGEFSIQRTLDLHGYVVDQAEKVFQSFLVDTVRAGLNCVKIIHGRGLKSKGPPVLKEGLKTWIVRAMHRKWVLAFCNAVMRDGGPGATYVLLKNKPRKERIRILG